MGLVCDGLHNIGMKSHACTTKKPFQCHQTLPRAGIWGWARDQEREGERQGREGSGEGGREGGEEEECQGRGDWSQGGSTSYNNIMLIAIYLITFFKHASHTTIN